MMGEDVGAAGGVFKQTEGLFAEFGAERVIDTPISESGRLRHRGRRRDDGLATGIRGDVRRLHHAGHGSAGQPGRQGSLHVGRPDRACRWCCARPSGIGANLGPQHSQSLHAWAAHVPGLKVVMPATPGRRQGPDGGGDPRRQSGGLLRGPHALQRAGTVPDGEYVVPIGRADVKRPGPM